ncbi:MAG: hypothetical protein ACQEQM_03075 [Thermoplasmatota archaeon]
MLSFIAIPGLFLIFMHGLMIGGYTDAANAILWILPLTLVMIPFCD